MHQKNLQSKWKKLGKFKKTKDVEIIQKIREKNQKKLPNKINNKNHGLIDSKCCIKERIQSWTHHNLCFI